MIAEEVLVTGANGHIGYNLVECLIRRGYQVRAGVRGANDPDKTLPLRKLGAKIYEMDVLNEGSLRAAISGVSGVFHTAAPHQTWAKNSEEEITRPYVEGTLSVLKLAHEYGVRRVVLTSSCAAAGLDSPTRPITEQDWNDYAVTPLVKAKVAMEKAAWQFARKVQLELISICPTLVIGPGFHRFTPSTQIFGQMLDGKMPPVPEGGCTFVDVRDLAELEVRAFETHKYEVARGRCSEEEMARYIVGGEYLTLSELFQRIKKLKPELKLPAFQFPVWVLYLFVPLDGLAHLIIGKPRELTTGLIRDFLGKFQVISSEKANRELGWNPRPLDQTLRDTFEWIEQRKPSQQKSKKQLPKTEIKSKPNASLWLKSRNFDLSFFQLSGLACLFLIIPYLLIGDSAIFPIYNFYLVFFGIPHNYLTWATLMPSSSRRTFNIQPIQYAAIVCAVIALLVPLTEGTDMNDWVLSVISYLSLWHAYRQHHGICKVYDTIQAKRTGDYSIYKDRKWMNLFFGFALFSVLVWAFTYPQIRYFLSLDESYLFIHPVIPVPILKLYLIVTGVLGALAFKQSVLDRQRLGKFLPWPQIMLMTIAIATYVVPYFFMPISAMPVAVAIGTIFHNVQYFGFVWLFEKHRSEELSAANLPLHLPQRLVHESAWVKYFSIALIYSLVMVVFSVVMPHQIGMCLIYFLSVAHYVIDGYIWKSDHNRLLSPVLGRIAAAGN